MKIIKLTLMILLVISNLMFAQTVADYFLQPHVGDYWIYHSNTLMGQANTPWTTNEAYEGVDTIQNEQCFRYCVHSTLDSDSSTIVLFYLWLTDNGKGRAFGDNSDVTKAAVFDPPLSMIPSSITIGTTWDFEIPGTEQIRSNYLESLNETLTVTAGTFNNCIKIKVTVKNTSGDTLATEYDYRAPGVGRILLDSSLNGKMELNNYSVTTTQIEGSKNVEISTQFYLTQNYPNPFNPNTTIKYEIPGPSSAGKQARNDNVQVILKVYNVLGKEVATLVNKEQPQGNHEVQWDASPLSSGVYYYQLRAGDFVDTKKMLLLK